MPRPFGLEKIEGELEYVGEAPIAFGDGALLVGGQGNPDLPQNMLDLRAGVGVLGQPRHQTQERHGLGAFPELVSESQRAALVRWFEAPGGRGRAGSTVRQQVLAVRLLVHEIHTLGLELLPRRGLGGTGHRSVSPLFG